VNRNTKACDYGRCHSPAIQHLMWLSLAPKEHVSLWITL
jgi:hypothetical protein